MRMYTVSFTEIAVSAQQDLFQLEANTVPVTIHGVTLSQTSDEGDSAAENLSIMIARITDTVTDDLPSVQADSGDATQLADIAINETSELTTGLEVYHSEAWNIALPFIWMPPPEMRLIVKVTDAMVVNLNNTPNDSLTMSGTMYFSESGG